MNRDKSPTAATIEMSAIASTPGDGHQPGRDRISQCRLWLALYRPKRAHGRKKPTAATRPHRANIGQHGCVYVIGAAGSIERMDTRGGNRFLRLNARRWFATPAVLQNRIHYRPKSKSAC
jgi:hypothetical protein